MRDKLISEIFDVTPRYLRSTNLERDFCDPRALENYVVTPHGRYCTERLAKGLRPNATERAWRLTGNYGTGKSSFALLLAHWFSGNTRFLHKNVGAILDYASFGITERPHYLPVLITGSREPMGRAVLRALVRLMDQQYTRGGRAALINEIAAAVERGVGFTDADVVRWTERVNAKLIKDGKANGLLILLDELGKFLEHAAYNPQQQDIFLLQKLAEAASASGREPLFVVGILHQGFNAYADNLGQAAQREWEKVAGRFEEILFNQPLVQTAQLIAAALRVREAMLLPGCRQEMKAGMEAAVHFGWVGSSPNRTGILALAPQLYPLHPTVLPVLVRSFRRFGQNERSLFSFLLSNEPFGLQEFAQRPLAPGNTYRLPDFYDYVRANFGYRLSVHSYRSHWAEIESMVDSFATSEVVELRVVKAVGVLNLLDQPDLLPTDETLQGALGGPGGLPTERIRAAIENLHKGRRVLYRRGVSHSYCLWSHTSVDLEAAYERATKAIGPVRKVGPALLNILESHPIVARRHYIQTGNLRYFDVCYAPVEEIERFASSPTTADGLIVVALCETTEDCRAGEKLMQKCAATAKGNVLVAVPTDPLSNHAGLVAESLRWNWVALNTPELNGDRFAREEVSRQKQAAANRLERRIQDLLGLRSLSGRLALRWYQGGRPTTIATPRQLLSRLSEICDRIYPDAPHITNELVNRRNLSSAAAAARMRLIERLFSSAHEELLGMDPAKKPPERSIYLSILRRGNLHRRGNKGWQLIEPDTAADTCRIRPVFQFIRSQLEQAKDTRIRLSELFARMEEPPYGVRPGLAPLLLAIYSVIHAEDIAFYEGNTFLTKVAGEEFMRIAKDAASFEIQLCRVNGLRADVFESLLHILEIRTSSDDPLRVLNIVRPLCQFVARLPDFARNSQRLAPETRAVRGAIVAAKEPVRLLFHELPVACGLPPFATDESSNPKAAREYAARLRRALDDLDSALSRLLDRMRDRIRTEFEVTGPFSEIRKRLAVRAEALTVLATEHRLKAVCLRFADQKLGEDAWLESFGSLVAQQPPNRWRDAEEDLFERELNSVAAKFRGLESIAFAKRGRGAWAGAYRVALTRDDGNEANEVVYVEPAEVPRVEELAAQVNSVLGKNRRLGMAALSRVAWEHLANK